MKVRLGWGCLPAWTAAQAHGKTFSRYLRRMYATEQEAQDHARRGERVFEVFIDVPEEP